MACLHSRHMLTWAPTECQVYLDIWQGHLSPLEDAGYLAVAPDFYHLSCSLLEHGIVPVTSDCHYLFPAKVVSRLVKWVTIAHEDYVVGRGVTGHHCCPGDRRLMSLPGGQEVLKEQAVHSLSVVTSRICISPKKLWRQDWLGTPTSTTWHSWKGAQVICSAHNRGSRQGEWLRIKHSWKLPKESERSGILLQDLTNSNECDRHR